MTKNLYYEEFFHRKNVLKEMLFDLFFFLASWPRLMLEVFIRKNMGERYFSSYVAVIIFSVFMFLPYLIPGMVPKYGASFFEVVGENLSWYAYLAAFAYACFLRMQEIERLPSVFDFARFSLSNGIIHPFFYALRLGGKPFDRRTIETIIEPGFFFLISLLLIWMDQNIGKVLAISSVMYSLSYAAAYHKGDNFIMDKIDKMILSEELVAVFIEDREPSETRGVTMYGRKPSAPETRRQLAKTFVVVDDLVEAR